MKAVRNYAKPKLKLVIQVLVKFANFYFKLIIYFKKIAIQFILILKISKSDWNINNNSKDINKHKVDMRKKKLNRGNKNINRRDFVCFDTIIALIELKQ